MMGETTSRQRTVIAAGVLGAVVASASAGYWFGTGRTQGELAASALLRREANTFSPGTRAAASHDRAQPRAVARDAEVTAGTDSRNPLGNRAERVPDGTALLEEAQQAARLPAPYERERALEASLESLAAVDPHAALAQARRLEPSIARRLVPTVIGAWAVNDVGGATEQAFLLEPAGLRMAAAYEILRRRLDLAPAERRSIAQQLGEPESTEWLLLEAGTDPSAGAARAALDEALGMAGQARRHQRLSDIASLLALDAPAEALALADGISDPRDRAAFKSTAAGLWADADPVAAASWLEQQDGSARWSVVTAVAGPYARSDPRGALDWAKRIDPQGSGGAWSAVIATIAETDPVTAVEHALAANIGQGPRSATTIAMAFLARKNPQLAMTYLERLPVGAARSQATTQIALEMARQGEPAQALDWLAARNDPAAERQGRARIAYTWATNDPAAALVFAERLPAQSRLEWQNAVVNALANVDPDGLVELIRARRGNPDFPDLLATTARAVAGRQPQIAISLANELSDATRRDEVLSTAIPQLAQLAPREAIELLDDIGDTERRAATTRTVVQVWAQRDADGAYAWVRTMPSGAERDQGFATLVPHLRSSRDMESAIRRIQSENVRSQAVFNAAMLLAQRGESEDARALVFRNPLEPAMMATLESRLRGEADAER